MLATNYLNELNDVQREAVVNIDGPVLVVAGPGSGKTRVLTYRIAHIIQQGAAPWEVLALTFTNKAAREMKQRIEGVVGSRAGKIWAGTFHSLFARILRVEAEHIGYSSNFTIYDTDDTKSLLTQIIKEMHLDTKVYNPNSIKNRISSAKSNLITPKLYSENAELMAQDRMAKMPLVHNIYAAYVKRCKAADAMDFDDLLYRLFELFQNHAEVVKRYREKFRYVLVDEFQDTNTLQYAIIKKLVQYPESPRNICVVGDDAQSIYAFRGATIQNILDFEQDFKPFGIKTFKLEENYRSTSAIVEAANAVINNNRRQIQKQIWSSKGEGQKVQLIRTIDDAEEGRRVADTILEFKNRHHLMNSDFAILYRTNAQSRVFEEYLRKFNIPYRVFGGQSFYQRKEVKDLVAYLRVVVNPNDEEALRRVINYPKRGIGKSSYDKAIELAQQRGTSVYEALRSVALPKRAQDSVSGFLALLDNARSRMDKADAYEIATYIAKKSTLLDTLRNDNSIDGRNRLDNTNALLDGIQSFVEDDTVIDTETLPDKSLATYLQNIALLTDADTQDQDNTEVVTLMSIHAAKGLEYKAVFVVGLEEKLFPSFMSMDSLEGLDEERRLFYVAITRAEEYLVLSYANMRYRFGQMEHNEPSRFLREVPDSVMESTSSLRGRRSEVSRDSEPARASISGHLAKKVTQVKPQIPEEDFVASPLEAIQPGVTVVHLKFGEGKVLALDGGNDNRIATIHFKDLSDPQKRIMLRFAKLQVIH